MDKPIKHTFIGRQTNIYSLGDTKLRSFYYLSPFVCHKFFFVCHMYMGHASSPQNK